MVKLHLVTERVSPNTSVQGHPGHAGPNLPTVLIRTSDVDNTKYCPML